MTVIISLFFAQLSLTSRDMERALSTAKLLV